MASATGIPEESPARVVETAREDEPLLGRPGDVTQADDEYLLKNLTSGKFFEPATMQILSV